MKVGLWSERSRLTIINEALLRCLNERLMVLKERKGRGHIGVIDFKDVNILRTRQWFSFRGFDCYDINHRSKISQWREGIEVFGTKTSLCGGRQKFAILTVSFFVLFSFFLIGKHSEESTVNEFLASRRNVMFFFPAFEENTLWNVPLHTTYSIGTNFCATEERKLSSFYVASPARENRFRDSSTF